MTFGDYIDRERREAAGEAKMEERVECILELLSELGEIPPELEARLYAQNDLDSLKRLLKLVAHVESIEEFEEQMDEVLKNTMAPV